MDAIEKSGKTVELALAALMQELNVSSLDKLEYEVIEEGAKGFLGFGSRDAVVRGKVKYNPEEIAKNFLREMFVAMGIVVEIETKRKEKQLLMRQ